MAVMSAREAKNLRIVSYNILDGGLGRLDPIYETLLYLDADVVGLVEADDPAGVAYLARKLRMEHVMAESKNSSHHVALLSRRPIDRMINLTVRLPHMKKAALEATITFDDEALRFVVLHLPAHFEDEDARMREIVPLLDVLDEHAGADGQRTVMMGDFNASAPYHPLNMAALKPSRRARLETIGGTPRHDVVNAVLERGYVDTYQRCHAGLPGVPASVKQTFTTGYPANRVDYIWVTPDLADRVAAADVETGGFAPYCSDHYPIWTELSR